MPPNTLTQVDAAADSCLVGIENPGAGNGSVDPVSSSKHPLLWRRTYEDATHIALFVYLLNVCILNIDYRLYRCAGKV
jgi:hypothetical protein